MNKRKINQNIAVIILLMFGSCVTPGKVNKQESPLLPDKTGFYSELLYPDATKRTPLFDDYSPENYRVDKDELVKEFPIYAQKKDKLCIAVIVIGPYGPLWTYHIIAILKSKKSDLLQVNAITMPHARITYKGTGFINTKQYGDLINKFTLISENDEKLSYDSSSAIFFYEKDKKSLLKRNINGNDTSSAFLKKLNLILDSLTTTYKHGQKIE